MNTTDRPRDQRVALGTAAALGALVWIAISVWSLEVEAFDAEAYFTIGLPVIAIGCAVLGFLVPVRAWRYGVVAMGTHGLALVLIAASGTELSMLPVGLAILALIAIPMALAGEAGTRAHRASRPPPR